MTKDELMQVYYMNKEIAAWKEELQRIQVLPQAVRLTGKGSSGKITDKVADAAVSIAETKKKIQEKIIELQKAKSEITNYILGIEDSQTRLIFKLRCINLLSWNAVADEVGGMNSEYTVKKRFYRYLEKCG